MRPKLDNPSLWPRESCEGIIPVTTLFRRIIIWPTSAGEELLGGLEAGRPASGQRRIRSRAPGVFKFLSLSLGEHSIKLAATSWPSFWDESTAS